MLNCEKNTDKEIVKKISSWDTEAFYCIVEKYENKLFKYILRITNIPTEEIENLLQEIFIKIYKNINNYDEKLSFSSRIYRIAHNTAIDNYRKNKNKINISLETDDEDYLNLIEMIDSGVDIEGSLKNKQLIEKIVFILNSLDKKYRDVLVLKFLEEKKYDEISDILKIPMWTVAILVNRGKKQFQKFAKANNLEFYL